MCGDDPINFERLAEIRECKSLLVAGVRAHALENYNSDGWDYVVECFEDAEILEEIGDAKTLPAAIENVRFVVQMLDERRRDIQSTIF